MNDWLEDLSEDWPSNPPSLAPSTASRSLDSSTGRKVTGSRTRQSLTQPRASNRRGHDGYKSTSGILSPRSPSEDNRLRVSNHRNSDDSVQLPKFSLRNSTSLSSTDDDVIVGTVAMTPSPAKVQAVGETPDWKKRLLQGDKGYKDQTDLFGPSGIQSIFQAPPPKQQSESKPTGLSFLKALDTIPSSPPWPVDNLDDPEHELEESDNHERNEELDPVVEAEETEVGQFSDTANDHDLQSPCSSKNGRVASHNTKPDILLIPSALETSPLRNIHIRSSAFAHSLRPLRVTSEQSARSTSDSFSAVYIGKHSTADGGVRYAPIDVKKSQLADHLAQLRISASTRSLSSRQNSASNPLLESPVRSDDLPEDLPHGTPDMLSLGECVGTKMLGDRCGLDENSLMLARQGETDECSIKNRSNGRTADDGNVEEQSADRRIISHKSLIDRRSSSRALSVASNFGQGELNEHEFPDDISRLTDLALPDELPSRSPSPDVLPPGFQRPFKFRVESAESVPEAVKNDTFKGKRKLSKVSVRSTLSVTKRNTAKRGSRPAPMDETHDMRSKGFVSDPSDSKRPPPSPFKNPTPKRRRTFLEPDLEAINQQPAHGLTDEVFDSVPETSSRGSNHQRTNSAIGKRKDARHGSFMFRADPEVLAQRQILRPRNPTPSQRRVRSGSLALALEATSHSLSSNPRMETIRKHLEEPPPPNAGTDAVQAHLVASEVAAFSQSISHRMKDESRKKSVTTQDFLDEAMKIMNFIRNNGRPSSGLGSLDESNLEEQDEQISNQMEQPAGIGNNLRSSISRPSSREQTASGWRDRPGLERRPSIMNHLDRYKEKDNEDFMASSVGSHLGQRVKQAVSKIENLQSDPPGIEIMKSARRSVSSPDMRDRNSSASTQATARSIQSSQASTGGTTGRTIMSRKSESVAVLPPEAVAHLIPEEVAGMTFDRENGLWKKRSISSTPKHSDSARGSACQHDDASSELNVSEDDPLGGIPDLTFDELEETHRLQQQEIDINTVRGAILRRHREREHGSLKDDYLDSSQSRPYSSSPSTPTESNTNRTEEIAGSENIDGDEQEKTIRSAETFEHEYHIDERRPEKAVLINALHDSNIQITDVATSNRTSSATIDRRDFGFTVLDTIADMSPASSLQSRLYSATSAAQHEAIPKRARPLSVLDEVSERSFMQSQNTPRVQQLVVQQTSVMAPVAETALCVQSSPARHSELTFYMSELSEFSVHQTDERQLTTRSRISGSTKPEDRYAWGNHVLVKTLQDCEPEEPYWEDLRAVNLSGKSLTSLHMLDQLCPHLENTNLSNNDLQQLSGAPSSLRCLATSYNKLSGLTWWGHLTNLQYLDVSNNNIDSLAGLGCLIHLRELNADHNRISDLDGIHDLDGLLKLSVRSNNLKGTLDFEGTQLSRLETLDLGVNAITELRGVSWLQGLRHLALDRNKLTSFCMEEGDAALRVKTLDLASNDLTKLLLRNCFPMLKDIKLDNNHLTADGLSFGSANDFQCISLRSQSLDDTDMRLPPSFPDTIALNLSLNTLQADVLSSLNSSLSIRCLELSNCGLSSLPDNFGLRAPNLRYLNLNFNAIKDLSSLLNIRHLTHLFCAGNRLARLRKTMAVLAKLHDLQIVDMRSNPFTLGFHDPASLSLTSASSTDLLALPSAEDMMLKLSSSTSLVTQFRNAPLHLPWRGSSTSDETAYLERLDADTRLRRRVYEMMLASSCKSLEYIDGYAFVRNDVLVRDEVWERLVALGVLKSKTHRAIEQQA